MTSGAEENLLKLRELRGVMTEAQQARWSEIKRGFARSALSERLSPAGLEAQVVGELPLFDVVFTPGNIHRYRDPLRVDAARMALFNAQLVSA